MLLLDVNVVVAVHRADHDQHAAARAWLDELLTADDPFCVPPLVWHSFLRLVTHRRVFTVATPRAEAFAFREEVVA